MSAIRLVHLSDTHSMHWTIEEVFPIPEADILVHTGDFTNNGTDAETLDFLLWLHSVSGRFRCMVLILGNHDWWDIYKRIESGELDAGDVVAPGFMQRRLSGLGPGLPSNCELLDHEETTVMGLRIFGSPWCPWHRGGTSEAVANKDPCLASLFKAWCKDRDSSASHRFDEVPAGLDVLLTHGPAKGINDCLGTPGRGWGSSKALRDAIMRTRPRMHLFGHLHEQRGEWRRAGSGYAGGIEYSAHAKAGPYPTTGPPPADYPCELVSCNAMANHPNIENADPCVAGGARLILVGAAAGGPSARPGCVQM